MAPTVRPFRFINIKQRHHFQMNDGSRKLKSLLQNVFVTQVQGLLLISFV